MKVAFKIDRIGFYRLFAPLIEVALSSGAEVILLHRDLEADRAGYKSYQWADPAAIPMFKRGVPEVWQWRDDSELVRLAADQGFDALVTVLVPGETPACRRIAAHGTAWVALQEAFELHALGLDALLQPDAVFMFSEWWVDLAERYLHPLDRAAFRSRVIATGWPELDAFDDVDRAAVRERFGIPRGAPVVTLASYKYHYDEPWEQIVFRSGGRITAFARSIIRRRPDMWPHIVRGVTYRGFLGSVRRFCDRNDAFLISKARMKDRPPRAERELADLALYDLNFHPPTIVEVLSITDVFISFLSTATLEAVYAGAYALCPLPPRAASIMHRPSTEGFGTLMSYQQPGSVWNFPGAVKQLAVENMMSWLPQARLEDLRQSPTARQEYAMKFMSGMGATHSVRTWQALVKAVATKRSTSVSSRTTL